jgi:predicted dinucleotide-binding enzyme
MAKQIIAIAGAERKMGFLVAKKLLQAGQHHLLILSEGGDPTGKLNALFRLNPAADPEIVDCLKDGCWEADMIMLDIPFASIREAAEKIREVSTQKIIFVISGDPDEKADPAGEWRSLLPNAKTVVALNLLNNAAMPLSTPDEDSLCTINTVIKNLGFEPISKSKN